MKIEILFSEICNLFGDMGNIVFLENTLKDAQFIYTKIYEQPRFITEDIDFVYIGSMTESAQIKVLNNLLPLKDKIKEKIDKGQLFLATGNAFEIFGEYILDEKGNRQEGLGIYKTYAKQQMMKRFNAFCLASTNINNKEIKLVGFKSQFALSYTENGIKEEDLPFAAQVIRGSGINKESKYELININNFYSTYILGPFLVVNPIFTKELLKKIGFDGMLAFEDVAIDAYNQRLKEFEDKSKRIDT